MGRTRLILLWVASLNGLLGACAGKPTHSESTPNITSSIRDAPAAAPSSASPAATLTDAAPLEAQADPATLLEQLDPDTRRDLKILKQMCRVGIGAFANTGMPELDGRVELGCTCCPPFDECSAAPEAPLTLANPSELFGLRHYHEGSFTKAGGDQLAATFWGCEPGFANRGGTVVFDRNGGSLEVSTYRTAVNPDDCQVLRGHSAPDTVVCTRSDGQGSTNYTRVVRYDLTKDIETPGAFEEIITLPIDGVCMLEAGFVYAISELDQLEVRDVNGDGRQDVVMRVSHRDGVITQAQMDRCRESEEFQLAPDNLPPPRPIELTFLSAANGFRPTPASRTTLQSLYAARDKFWQQLNGGP